MPEWAVGLVEMKATRRHIPGGYTMRGMIAGRAESSVVCYWLIPSDRVDELRVAAPEGTVHSDAWENPFAIAVTHYEEGRMVSIELKGTTMTPEDVAPKPTPPEPPAELSIDRLGAALEEIVGEQE